MPKKPDKKAEHPTLPFVDTSRKKTRESVWVVDFTKKPEGYSAGREMTVRKCPSCGHNGVKTRRDDGVYIYDHVREYYIHGGGRTSSRSIQRCFG